MQRNPSRPGPLTGSQEEIPFDDYSADEFAALYCDGERMPRDVETIRLVEDVFRDAERRRTIAHTRGGSESRCGMRMPVRQANELLFQSLVIESIHRFVVIQISIRRCKE